MSSIGRHDARFELGSVDLFVAIVMMLKDHSRVTMVGRRDGNLKVSENLARLVLVRHSLHWKVQYLSGDFALIVLYLLFALDYRRIF